MQLLILCAVDQHSENKVNAEETHGVGERTGRFMRVRRSKRAARERIVRGGTEHPDMCAGQDETCEMKIKDKKRSEK